MDTKYRFTKEDTKLMKGIAVLLMLAHHLWAFPDRLVSELPMTSLLPQGMELAAAAGNFGKLCVSLFMFLGGVGTYFLYKQQRLDWFTKIHRLYVSYWKVFFLFVPLGFLFFRGQPDYCAETVVCHVFDQFHLSEFFANVAGISCTYNREWWFLFSYLAVLAAFPLIARMIQKNTFGINLWIVCMYQILSAYIFPALYTEKYFPALDGSWLYHKLVCQSAPWAACFWCGCVFAKDHMLEKCRQKLDEAGLLNPAAALAAMAGIFMLRSYVTGAELDIFYAPVLCILGTCLLDGTGIVKKCILKLGNQSTNMWLLHSFLIYYFYETARMILSVRNVMLAYWLFVGITYMLACFVDRFYFWFSRACCRLREIGAVRK